MLVEPGNKELLQSSAALAPAAGEGTAPGHRESSCGSETSSLAVVFSDNGAVREPLYREAGSGPTARSFGRESSMSWAVKAKKGGLV